METGGLKSIGGFLGTMLSNLLGTATDLDTAKRKD